MILLDLQYISYLSKFLFFLPSLARLTSQRSLDQQGRDATSGGVHKAGLGAWATWPDKE